MVMTGCEDGARIVVYWRPGCPFCMNLRWWIHRRRLPVTEIDIWQDPAAASTVRSITGGDETVPTVVVGTVSLVNPSPSALLRAVREQAPELAGAVRPGWFRRLVRGPG